MHKFIAQHFFYDPIQYLRGQRVKDYMPQARNMQFIPLEALYKTRDQKLREVVRHAYHTIPYYKEVFDHYGCTPEEIKGFDDLVKLPVLSKREILENEHRLIDPTTRAKLYLRKTGGSTGMTLHFKKEAPALARNDAIMYRCYEWYGIELGDTQARFWGVPVVPTLRWREQLKDFILNRVRISAFDISPFSCIKQYELIRKFKPAYFYGYTTAIYGFARIMQEQGIDLNTLHLKAVICTAEKMYPHHRALFNTLFTCPVVDEYGSSENGIIAFQCTKGNMHIMSDHLCVEFLNEHNQRVHAGELGRIVITDLSSYAMPMIRYDIGDIGMPTDAHCTCGVTLPLMDIVEGRKEDFIKTTEGKLVHAAYLCYTLKDDTVHEFKMYQKAINHLHVQIVQSPLFTSDSEKTLQKKLRTALGDDPKITFEYLERIPRDASGKLRYFVSELSHSPS